MIGFLALLATLAVIVATAVSFLRDWRFALLAHFRPHLASAALLCLLLAAVVDLPHGAGLAVLLAAPIALLINLWQIVRATPRGAPVADGRRLRLAFANLLRSNHDERRVIDWARRERVDVLVVAEALELLAAAAREAGCRAAVHRAYPDRRRCDLFAPSDRG